MEKPSYELAASPGFGRVYRCGHCDCIHLAAGPVTLAFTPSGYLQLVEMVNRSAANFELLLERANPQPRGEPSSHCPGVAGEGG